MRVKAILNKDPGKRTEADIEVIINLIKEIEFFRTSDLPVRQEVADFLAAQTTKIAFNKYCIDCTKNRTSHFIVWTGTFVCRKCAQQHM